MKFRRLSNQAAGVVRVEMGKRIRGKKCLDSGSFMQFQVGEFMCA